MATFERLTKMVASVQIHGFDLKIGYDDFDSIMARDPFILHQHVEEV
jgi:hypothetical protein